MPEVRIAVVPVGRIDPAEIEDVLSRVVKLQNRAIELRESVPLPKTAEDVSRGQFRSNIVLAEARAALPRLKVSKLVGAAPGSAPVATPQPTAAIFITDVDLYSPSTEAVMAQADTKQRAAIVSVRRLREAFYRRKADPAKQRARLVKEVLRAIGTLHGLPECPDPSCALSVTQVLVDIDRKAERYCGTCLKWTLLDAGASQREIDRVTGIDRKRIRAYQKRFAAAAANSPGVSTDPGQFPPPRPPSPMTAVAAATVSACEPHRAFIEAQLRLRRNAMAIYQDLVDQHGFVARYSSVMRFVRQLRHREPEQFDRLEFLPGEEMQVDYGEGAPTRVPGTDRYRKPRLFVATLRYSRKCFRRVVWKSSQETWARLHEQAWRHFGGSCRYVVLDNLKEGVAKPDLYDPNSTRSTEPRSATTAWSPTAIALGGYFGSAYPPYVLPAVPGDCNSPFNGKTFPYVIKGNTTVDHATSATVSGGLVFKLIKSYG